MKKLLVIMISFLIIFTFTVNTTFGLADNCEINPDLLKSGEWEIGDTLDKCLSDATLVNGTKTSIAGGDFGLKIKTWVNNISIYLGVFAVGSIVLGAFMLTLSGGEEEKITKAKDVVKWGIIGFLGLIFASAILNLVIKVMYSL